MGNTVNLINSSGTYTLSGVCSDGRYLNKSTMTVESVIRKMNEGKITPMKRFVEYEWTWNRRLRSNLILSILKGYPIGRIYLHCNNDTYEIIDGRTRINTLNNFINNKYHLNSDIPSVPCVFKNDKDESIIGNYNIAGKSFEDLPEALQNIILWYNLDVVEIHEYKDKDVDEMISYMYSI